MAVLVAVAIPTVSSITGSAKKSVQDTNARTIESVLKLAEAEASKTGNGVVALDATKVAQALVDAKLGIDEGSFMYNTKTGTCAYTTATAGTADGDILIAFGKTSVTATPKGGTAVTKEYTSVTATTAANPKG